MTQEIAHINISALNKDIAELEKDVSILENDLNSKKAVLEAKKQLLNLLDVYKVNNNNSTTVKTPAIPKDLGITEFILAFLERGKTDTGDIIKAYIDYSGIDKESASNNVSNTLYRLKGKKVTSEVNEGGRRAGSKWFLIKENG